jgi:two-component system chemotaxis response regulator CheB
MNGPATPVILLSSLERKDEQIFEALKAGAFDFVEKPQARLDDDDGQPYALIPLIKAAAQSGRKTIQGSSSKNFNHHTFEKELPYDIVVIGSSTGGPSAIESILDNLPKNLAVPVVVAQHMPERFIETFAQRLNAKNILKVKIAEDGGTLDPGCVYLCPGHQNVRISRITSAAGPCFEFTSKRYREFNFPSVDCLFESVAETFAHKSVAVILTGMGKDGTEGIKKIKSAGGYTIAQDESSCVIFGMPKSAFDSGAIRQVLALPEIPGFIVSCLS